ncbi:hypothetical protein NDU88_001143 [Pleurodeles waltl]|uniref:Uncharacterized protein n=1 Tax=Pleurodeles waltl TaxID=8319 RepID=A0AAV7THG9_PLEWA|nr:hypothetical protein NDU88_001143 [Pleurodeles waltl]
MPGARGQRCDCPPKSGARMDLRHDAEVVRPTLRTLGEAERADLLQPGVLEEAWVSMERLTQAASWGLVAAVAACS